MGGADLEMADPRLNEQVLRRIATASGGSTSPAGQTSELSALLRSVEPEASAPQLQELWHNVWIFVAVMMLLAVRVDAAAALGAAVIGLQSSPTRGLDFGRWALGFGF